MHCASTMYTCACIGTAFRLRLLNLLVQLSYFVYLNTCTCEYNISNLIVYFTEGGGRAGRDRGRHDT